MSSIRPAAVAGTFYPGDPADLAAEVAAYLAEVPSNAAGPAPKALIAPHAGYMYSGEVAARAYARVASRADAVRRVVLAGPAHRVYVRGVAVPGVEAFDSPLGCVPVDAGAVAMLRSLPFVEVSARAHAFEHS